MKTTGAKKQHTLIRSNAHILLVDDEPQVIALGKEMLHTVEVTIHSKEAIERVRQAPSQLYLLITALSMPVVSGLALAAKVHALRLDLPVVLCSGLTMQVNPVAAEMVGFSQFIDKPYIIFIPFLKPYTVPCIVNMTPRNSMD